jgi:hypothetical protein
MLKIKKLKNEQNTKQAKYGPAQYSDGVCGASPPRGIERHIRFALLHHSQSSFLFSKK